VRIRDSLLELDLREDGTLIAKVNGIEVARSSMHKMELSWEVFA
jgi:hypothetical protein